MKIIFRNENIFQKKTFRNENIFQKKKFRNENIFQKKFRNENIFFGNEKVSAERSEAPAVNPKKIRNGQNKKNGWVA